MYTFKCLFVTFLSLMIFLIYLNVKYFPVRTRMISELNEQFNTADLHLQQIVHKVLIDQVQAIEKLEVKPTNKTRILKDDTELNKRHNYICIHYIGGLGNIMFLYASAYSLSRAYNMDLVIPISNDLLNIFNLSPNNLRIIPNYTLCKGFPDVGERQNSAFNEHFLKINYNTSFWIRGYLQSYKYFESLSGDIRSQFTFKRPIQEEADSILFNITRTHLQSNGINQPNVTLIGVHNRRGDMVGNDYGYNVGTKEYFKKSMDWFRSKYPNAAFVVCSNDIPWSKENMPGKDVYFVENRTRQVDMAVLATSDHLVSSVGSFSWWASWLCKGTVTYFFPPAKEGSDLRRAYSQDYSDYFLSKWIHF